MNKEEAYKAHYPDSPELYRESVNDPDDEGFVELGDIMPEASSESPADKPTKKWPIVLAFIIGAALATFIIIYSGLIPESITGIGVNEATLNQTYYYGYNLGVVETSQRLLTTGVVPYFNITSEGVQYLGDLNLTEMFR